MRDRQIRLKGRIYNQLSKLKGNGQTWSEFLEPLIPGIKRELRLQRGELQESNRRTEHA